eukprot:scaffold28677_cov112-Isochrysis_galbana.AAC.11
MVNRSNSRPRLRRLHPSTLRQQKGEGDLNKSGHDNCGTFRRPVASESPLLPRSPRPHCHCCNLQHQPPSEAAQSLPAPALLHTSPSAHRPAPKPTQTPHRPWASCGPARSTLLAVPVLPALLACDCASTWWWVRCRCSARQRQLSRRMARYQWCHTQGARARTSPGRLAASRSGPLGSASLGLAASLSGMSPVADPERGLPSAAARGA